ncbi:hypothetical protein SBRCBS47491_008516 [Sporothrix bragantina]|uniref:Zn(2)-C6 fungal-type domain-containing protein n=1 Tax=Sporothrix bragantina TaxID=671064 RepID=A0ABP0CQ66_9PEZI
MADDGGPASPVIALREAFGDRKPPDISRKITACVACRKQKIKCHMADGQAPCMRCKKRGLPCTVNRSLQMLLESDTTWKHAMENKMRRLEAIVASVAKDTLSADTLQLIQEQNADNRLENNIIDQSGSNGDGQIHHPATKQSHVQDEGHEHNETDADQARHSDQGANHWEIVMDLESGPGEMPGFYISETPPSGTAAANSIDSADTNGHNRTARQQTDINTRNPDDTSDHSTRDFISRGIIPLDRAQDYFDNYQNRMDHFPYCILCYHGPVSLARLRSTSPLLVAVVCSVGALHMYDMAGGTADFDRLYAEFVSLCSRKVMSKACTMDDVRALCIGAFWLGGDLSWSLVGAAVRMATELQLYRSFRRALTVDENDSQLHYLRTRLWYLVYVCDHHFSVVYGRPPLTREDESVRDARRFANGPHATEDDARLVSQVLRWSLCTNIFDTFGVDVAQALTDDEVPQLRRFGLALDGLRAEWVDRFRPNPHVGNYPRKGVMLQYNFARLYLYSHAFRGLPEGSKRENGHGYSTAMDIDEAANAGVLVAFSILQSVVSDTEIQSYLDGLPIYFHVMIAFAAVFLLKVSSKFASLVLINAQEIQSLVITLVATLKRVTQSMHPRHLLSSITKGIESLLHRSGLASADGNAENAGEKPSPPLDVNGERDSTLVVQTIGSTTEEDEEAAQGVHGTMTQLTTGQHDVMLTESQGWLEQTQPDPYFMGEYDFLMNQDMDFEMQFGMEP